MLIPEKTPAPQMNLIMNFVFSGTVVFHCFFNIMWTICSAICAVCDSMNANKRKVKEIMKQQAQAKKKIEQRKKEILEGNKKNEEQAKKSIMDTFKKQMNYLDDDCQFNIMISRDIYA